MRLRWRSCHKNSVCVLTAPSLQGSQSGNSFKQCIRFCIQCDTDQNETDQQQPKRWTLGVPARQGRGRNDAVGPSATTLLLNTVRRKKRWKKT